MNYIAKIIINSLHNSILYVIGLDDNFLVQSKNPKVELNTLLVKFTILI